MDKYDKFIADVINRTETGDLEWEVRPPSEAVNLIYDYSKIARCYRTKYKKSPPRDLLLVEKLRERFTDYDERYEELVIELLILNTSVAKNVCIFTVNDDYVDRASLRRLSELVHAESTDANEFFEEFDDDAT